jgi:hypothetical protein
VSTVVEISISGTGILVRLTQKLLACNIIG